MSISGIINSQGSGYINNSNINSKDKKSASETKSTKENIADGVVYEAGSKDKTDSAKSIDYSSIVQELKGAQAEQTKRMQNLVNSLLNKQAGKYNTLADLFNDIANGKVEVDPALVKQAEEDVSEDGYWGVNQTSDRLVSMAQALSGGDPEKADKMIAAVEKGFKQATKSWGGDLPEICSKTVETTKKKLEAWRDGKDITE